MCALAHYRQRQIRTAVPPVDTLFVGDSTLGYALDDRRFSRLRGAQTINLGTAGYAFGLPGAYSFIVQSLEHFRPKNIVIMLTPQTFSQSMKDLDYDPIKGFVLTSRDHLMLLFSIDARTTWLVLRQFALMASDSDALRHRLEMLALRKTYSANCENCSDFFADVSRDVIDVNKVSQSWTHPTGDYQPFLRKISAICTREEINCIYVHSTLLSKLCDEFGAYIGEISKMVEESGIRVIQPAPICVPAQEIGDSFNHVRPDYRGKYTDTIYGVVAPYLK